MRVAVLVPHTSPTPQPGEPGPTRVIRNLCDALADVGQLELVAVRVKISPCETTRSHSGGYERVQCWLGNVARVLKTYKPGILQTFSSTATSIGGLYTAGVARALGVSWVDTVLGLVRTERTLGYPHSPQQGLFEMMRVRWADCLVVPSQHALQIVREERVAAGQTRLKVIPFGVDQAWLNAGSTTRAQPSRVPELAIVSVGGIAPIKGQDILLRSFILARVRGSVRFVGPALDYRYLAELAAMAHAAGPDKKVEFLGKLTKEQTIKVELESNVFALLSRFDLFPSAVTEAMALGLAPIVARSVGVADLLEEGDSGYVTEDGSISSVAHVLESIAADMTGHWQRGLRAKSQVQALNWKSVAEQYAGLYAELLNSSSLRGTKPSDENMERIDA